MAASSSSFMPSKRSPEMEDWWQSHMSWKMSLMQGTFCPQRERRAAAGLRPVSTSIANRGLPDELVVQITEEIVPTGQTFIVAKNIHNKWDLRPELEPTIDRRGNVRCDWAKWNLGPPITVGNAVDVWAQRIMGNTKDSDRGSWKDIFFESVMCNTLEFKSATIFKDFLKTMGPQMCSFLRSITVHVGTKDTHASLDEAFLLLGNSHRLWDLRIILNDNVWLWPRQLADPTRISWFRHIEGYRGLHNIFVFYDKWVDLNVMERSAPFKLAIDYLSRFVLEPKSSDDDPVYEPKFARKKAARSQAQFYRMGKEKRTALLKEAGEDPSLFRNGREVAERLSEIEGWMFRTPCDRTEFGMFRAGHAKASRKRIGEGIPEVERAGKRTKQANDATENVNGNGQDGSSVFE
jgi:hypothetical protein